MDSRMHFFRAPSMLSDFRVQRLQQQLAHFLPTLSSTLIYDDYILALNSPLGSPSNGSPSHAASNGSPSHAASNGSPDATPDLLSDTALPLSIKASLEGLLPEACALPADRWGFPLLTQDLDQSHANYCVCTVTPRLGTLSAWSSQAGAILSACGRTEGGRLEKVQTLFLYGVTAQQLQDASRACRDLLYDPLTQSLLFDRSEFAHIFTQPARRSMNLIALQENGGDALKTAQHQLGLGLAPHECDYFTAIFERDQRPASDVELMMFSQVNSEHCRHKTFNRKWQQDGVDKEHTLFAMIRHTHQKNPQQVLVAYSDNAAVMQPTARDVSAPEAGGMIWRNQQHCYQVYKEALPWVFKVETHNHPTGISPHAGAATGAGGEIRDEAATGRGSRTKAGLCGFMVSHLQLPEDPMPWEGDMIAAPHLASALDIMLQGPIGAAAYNNEFGRPNVCGYFRNFQIPTDKPGRQLGFTKPIMLAGGIGVIRPSLIHKKILPAGALLLVLGGEAMAIGLGGGAASSRAVGSGQADLDFASVQRANPEMERRAQEVIDACCALGEDSPILSMHDVGAGGLCNAIPELVDLCGRGAEIDLQRVPSLEPAMSPLEIWCNEAQERFVLAIEADALDQFAKMADRERCPYAVLGQVTEQPQLVVTDGACAVQSTAAQKIDPVCLQMSDILGEIPLPVGHWKGAPPAVAAFDRSQITDLHEALTRILQFPCVASKSFLITIGDRTVGGLTARDQMVGPWQIPVADVAVLAADYTSGHGEAMALGERAPLACMDPAASARMAAAEAITNLAAADVEHLSQVVMSANWMADIEGPGQAAALYEAVEALAMEFCPALGIAIPVGKDSLSMRSTWEQDGRDYEVSAPVTLSISAAAPVRDVACTLTPQLQYDVGDTDLWFFDLSGGKMRLGGSVLAQVYQQLKAAVPDCDNPALLQTFFKLMTQAKRENMILAYHDRSDGGLFVTLCEMMFAGHGGVTILLDELGQDALSVLANEELGAVVQISRQAQSSWLKLLTEHDLLDHCYLIGEPNSEDSLSIVHEQGIVFSQKRIYLQQLWARPSYHMQKRRDHPDSAEQEFNKIADPNDTGLKEKITFDHKTSIAAPYIATGVRPRLAICREQGVNGYREMAAAFMQAGFDCYDVHMTDLQQGRFKLDEFVGLVACGGFSYGDVLGAGRGWAQSILQSPQLRDQFSDFFARSDRFALGVCNGCQMLSQLKSLIPGADHWPQFLKNNSEQFEARFVSVEVMSSPSIFLQGMEGSVIPVVVAHGEGRTAHQPIESLDPMHPGMCLRYVDAKGEPTEQYPDNPNGSAAGVTAFCNEDGRVTIMMPHPERVFRSLQCSWRPAAWGETTPWSRLFDNARAWVGK